MSNNVLEVMKEKLDELLLDYLQEGYATFEFDLINGKGPKVLIRTIPMKNQLAVESAMKNVSEDEIAISRLHIYHLKFLSHTVLAFDKYKFKTPEEAEEYLKTRGTAVLDKILQVQNNLERLFREELTGEDIENFTETPSTDIAQN